MKKLGFAGSARIISAVMAQQWPFRPRELLQHGVSHAWIGRHPLVFVERLDRGIYGEKRRGYPRVVIACTRTERSFACLFSALWLHGLFAREPPAAWLCIGHKAWKPRPGLTKTQFIRTSLWPVREDLCLLSNWAVPATTLPRTAVDFMRMRRRVGEEAARAAHRLILQSGKCTQAEIDACAARYLSSS